MPVALKVVFARWLDRLSQTINTLYRVLDGGIIPLFRSTLSNGVLICYFPFRLVANASTAALRLRRIDCQRRQRAGLCPGCVRASVPPSWQGTITTIRPVGVGYALEIMNRPPVQRRDAHLELQAGFSAISSYMRLGSRALTAPHCTAPARRDRIAQGANQRHMTAPQNGSEGLADVWHSRLCGLVEAAPL